MSGMYLESSAVLSPCGAYRYSLYRSWEYDPRPFVVIGLNPSTADAELDDPTIRRCVSFAKREGCGMLTMLNLFALRSTSPHVLRTAFDPIGPSNDAALRINTPPDAVVVAAWGVHGALNGRASAVRTFLPNLLCFGTTKDGHPRHPLYLPSDAPLIPLPAPSPSPGSAR